MLVGNKASEHFFPFPTHSEQVCTVHSTLMNLCQGEKFGCSDESFLNYTQADLYSFVAELMFPWLYVSVSSH